MNSDTSTTAGDPEISIVICTCDRPDSLRRLLESIRRQRTSLCYEVIIVDNRPGSGTSRLVGDARWIDEARPGLSRARNAGIRAARAPVVAFLDDDMVVEPDWLEQIAAPVVKDRFDATTAPTSPIKLESEAERLFEAYGGHGHKGGRRVFDGVWLKSHLWALPLWEVGGFGNAAVRREVFFELGLFDEALGAGTPAGSWEDLEMIYRMLAANRRILQNPAATVLHAHRENLRDLTRQLCSYRRGEVCFCLLTLWRVQDPRCILHLLLWIPYLRLGIFVGEIGRRLGGRKTLSFRLMVHESVAYFTAPLALLRSLHGSPSRSRPRA